MIELTGFLDSMAINAESRNPGRAHPLVLKHLQTRFAEHGNQLALMDALILCSFARVPLPDWLAEGLLGMMRDALNDGYLRGQGRGNSPTARALQFIVWDTRFWAVAAVRQAQGKPSKKIEWTGYSETSPELLREELFSRYAKPPVEIGATLDRAYEVASELLLGTLAFGAPREMKRAWAKGAPGRDADLFGGIVTPETRLVLGLPNLP
jgi:hypothetical protein